MTGTVKVKGLTATEQLAERVRAPRSLDDDDPTEEEEEEERVEEPPNPNPNPNPRPSVGASQELDRRL